MSINYELNRKYFNGGNFLAKVGGLCLLVGGWGAFKGSKSISIFLVLGIAILFFYFKNRPTGAKLDQQCAEVIATIKERALEKLGIDEDQVSEATPIFFDGYFFERKWEAKYRKEDSVWRSSNYQGSVFFFSAEQVYYYSYMFSLIDNKYSDDTEEYFYKDIVSVATKSEEVPSSKEDKNESITYEVVSLTTSGGTSIKAAFRNVEDVQKSITDP